MENINIWHCLSTPNAEFCSTSGELFVLLWDLPLGPGGPCTPGSIAISHVVQVSPLSPENKQKKKEKEKLNKL